MEAGSESASTMTTDTQSADMAATEESTMTPDTELGGEEAPETSDPIDDSEPANDNPDVADEGENKENTEQPKGNTELLSLKEENQKMKEQLDQVKDVNEKIRGMWEQFPEIPGLISDLHKGAPLSVALAKNFDLDDIKPMEGDPDFDEFAKAGEERKAKQQKLSEQQKILDDNIDLSRKEMEEFKKENNLDEEQAQGFFDNVNQFLDQIFQGKVDRKILSMFQKAMNADKEIETARKQAEIKTRNEKIEAKKKEDEKKSITGIPDLKKGQAGKSDEDTAPPPADPFASAFDRARTRRMF